MKLGPSLDPSIHLQRRTAEYLASPEERARQDAQAQEFFNAVADGVVATGKGIKAVLVKAGEVFSKRFRPTQLP